VETDRKIKLRIQNLSLSFGGVSALVDVSMDIRDKEILAIIGPNGAGKTALLNCIMASTSLKRARYTTMNKNYPNAPG